MRKTILLCFCMVVFLSLGLSPALKANATDNVFEVISIHPDWNYEAFLDLPFTTAAIAFDSEGNVYTSNFWVDSDLQTKTILKLEAPSYTDFTTYAFYDTPYFNINGLDFDDKQNLFVSEFMASGSGSDSGAIRKIYANSLEVSDPIEFLDFRPTGIVATAKDTIYFPGRKWSDLSWGNLYLIDSFEKFDPYSDPVIVREDVVLTAISRDEWGNFFAGTPEPNNEIKVRNPYTGDLETIAKFNQYVEELAFGPDKSLYVLEGVEPEDPSTIIKFNPPYILIDGCNTGIIDWEFSDGRTIGGMIQSCQDSANNHGEFVSCVVHLTNELMFDQIIDAQQMAAIVTCAAQASIP